MRGLYRISGLLMICMFLVSCEANILKKYVFQQGLMYTSFDIVVYTKKPKYLITQKIEKLWKKLEDLEYDLSPAGQGILGELNNNGVLSYYQNPKIFTIISDFIFVSQKINQQSQGAFDLTVYPLVRLWGFYIQDKCKRVPTDQEIENVLTYVGMNKVFLTSDQIRLSENVKLDLGAIAKGYAIDVAITELQQDKSIEAGFVNAGGNVRVFGSKPDKTPWKVGIRNPNGQKVEEVINLYDGESIATSGDYEQFFIVDGNHYHHIFNPITGRPAKHSLASVSVVLKGTAEMADILATTFLSLGKEKTLKMQSRFQEYGELSLFFIERQDGNLLSSSNELWKKRI